MSSDAKPAEVLVGAILDNGWAVVDRLVQLDDATGGTFSVPYIVQREASTGRERAFLKALDFTMVRGLGLRLADAMQMVTNAYIFERDLVLECAGRKMSNVVRGLDAGEVTVDPNLVAPEYSFLSSVPYIIFEIADGDVRTIIAKEAESLDAAWCLRVLHGTANGLRQLHQAGITHQDLKPSNVMSFSSGAKVGDLGRASVEGRGLFDGASIAGDRTYAPPELLYRELQPDDKVRRRACDMYHLGSMVVFMFGGTGLTSLIEAEMDPAFHWRSWPRDFRSVLPYVRDAFDRVLERLEARIPETMRGEIIKTLRELADPDPLIRGNPTVARGAARYGMERYVSAFDRLARRAEIDLRTRLK